MPNTRVGMIVPNVCCPMAARACIWDATSQMLVDVTPACVCCAEHRPPAVSTDDPVVGGYLGNTVLQRFKLTGKAALITGECHRCDNSNCYVPAALALHTQGAALLCRHQELSLHSLHVALRSGTCEVSFCGSTKSTCSVSCVQGLARALDARGLML